MAITKILYRNGGLRQAIDYITNPAKTNEQLLTDYVRCDPGYAAQQMMDTKRALGKTAGRQCYHIIQSFKPNEITPELAHEIAKQFAAEHLPGYEAVIATHVDKAHIHSHIVFNSVNAVTGKMYHSTRENYYKQIRGVSDRLCKAHGLSIVLENGEKKAISYAEWLRQKKSQPTFRSMLEADLHDAIEDANDLGHFFLLMEHRGYEIHHGKRLGFRLRGQEHSCVRNAEILISRKSVSSRPFWAIWSKSKPEGNLPSRRSQSRSHTAHIQSTRDSLRYIITTAICLIELKNGSTRRA